MEAKLRSRFFDVLCAGALAAASDCAISQIHCGISKTLYLKSHIDWLRHFLGQHSTKHARTTSFFSLAQLSSRHSTLRYIYTYTSTPSCSECCLLFVTRARFLLSQRSPLHSLRVGCDKSNKWCLIRCLAQPKPQPRSPIDDAGSIDALRSIHKERLISPDLIR